MSVPANRDEYEVEVISPDSATLAVLQSAEIDTQIATAKRYPRSIKAFRDQALELATLDEQTAMECMYSLPRADKKITGPSARLAEIVASCWGNCRYAARVIEEQKDFVVAQGVFHDLEKNSFVSFEVKRRITDSKGRRYNTDMIAVTGNAACSIALRNAVFKGVPKALWNGIYMQAVNTAFGKNRPLKERRAVAMEYFTKAGAKKEDIFAALGVADESEITIDDLVWLGGVRTAVMDGEYSIEAAFSSKTEAPQKRTLDMVSGQIKDPGQAALDEDEIPHQQPRQKQAEPQETKAKDDKAKASRKPKSPPPPPPPPPEPEVTDEVEDEEPVSTSAASEEDEKIDTAEKPPVDLDKALADIPAWVDLFVDYYAALPKEEEDGFLDEIHYIQRQIRKDDFEQYQRMAEAINDKGG